MFSISPLGYAVETESENINEVFSSRVSVKNAVNGRNADASIEVHGDVFVACEQSMDITVWKLGGASVPLRMVELASVCIFHRQKSSNKE